MATKRTSSDGTVKPAAKLPAKRKVVSRPAPAETKPTKPLKAAVERIELAPTPPAPTIQTEQPALPPLTQLAPEQIALRAYYISEQRHAAGQSGDSLSDWLEAERQLLSEGRS